jgi:hypothetical protein
MPEKSRCHGVKLEYHSGLIVSVRAAQVEVAALLTNARVNIESCPRSEGAFLSIRGYRPHRNQHRQSQRRGY